MDSQDLPAKRRINSRNAYLAGLLFLFASGSFLYSGLYGAALGQFGVAVLWLAIGYKNR